MTLALFIMLNKYFPLHWLLRSWLASCLQVVMVPMFPTRRKATMIKIIEGSQHYHHHHHHEHQYHQNNNHTSLWLVR
jgi:hypothetical protein